VTHCEVRNVKYVTKVRDSRDSRRTSHISATSENSVTDWNWQFVLNTVLHLTSQKYPNGDAKFRQKIFRTYVYYFEVKECGY
jgi:hypothetical protein